MYMLKQFYKENKVMVQIFSGSCLVSISYLISNIFPETFMEWFSGADEVYCFFSDVSLAIIASVIFYYIQSFVPNYNRRIVFNTRIKSRCKKILDEMITPINYMAKNYLPQKVKEISYTEDELWEISKRIKFDDKVDILDPVTLVKLNTRQMISEQIIKVDYQIDKLFLYCEPYINEKIVEILDKILGSEYKLWMNTTTRSNIFFDFSKMPKNGNFLIEYYRLYSELKGLIDKM